MKFSKPSSPEERRGPMIRSLLWKEWREHCWKLLACLAVLLVPHLVNLFWNRQYINVEIAPLTGFTLAIWMAAWTITSEYRTQRMLEALPISPWLSFGFKSLAGLLTFLIPLALTINPYNPFVSDW